MSETLQKPFGEWAILEIMGHHRFAGFISEQTVGGASFVRIDVPAVAGQPAFSKLFGAGSIYCISPVTEDLARLTAAGLRVAPLSVYDLPDEIRQQINRPRLPASSPAGDAEEWDDSAGLDEP